MYSAKINQLDSEGRKQGYWKVIFRSNVLPISYYDGMYNNDECDGGFKFYNKSGCIFHAFYFLNGIKEGEDIIYEY